MREPGKVNLKPMTEAYLPGSDLLLPAQLTTELEAINTIISTLGDSPVQSIAPSPSPDVDKALVALNESNREVQSRGWKWNQEVAWPITPSPTNGHAYLPFNCVAVQAAYYIPFPLLGACQPRSIVARGGRLYDAYNHTYVFNLQDQIFVDMTILLEWWEMPEQARRVITLEAAKKYISREGLSGVTLQVNEADLQRAWALLEQKEDLENTPNAIYGNLDSLTKIMGTGSMRRGRING